MGRDTRYSEFRVVYCRHRVDMPFVMLIGSTEFPNRLFFGGRRNKVTGRWFFASPDCRSFKIAFVFHLMSY